MIVSVEHISARAPDALAYAVEAAIIRGSGIEMPLGILNSGATITVAEDSGQTAATISYSNVLKMWNRTIASARQNGTWIVNPDADLMLQQLVHHGSAGDVAASASVWSPPSSFAPNGSLFGRPIVYSESCSSLGTVGDIIFGDLSAYLTAVKMLRQDISIHLWFDFDITAYRFVLRIGGQPWASAPTPSANGTTRSFFTTLATRS
jgi:HK97 family phage major capsid protein